MRAAPTGALSVLFGSVCVVGTPKKVGIADTGNSTEAFMAKLAEGRSSPWSAVKGINTFVVESRLNES
jgi:hypothetical protein